MGMEITVWNILLTTFLGFLGWVLRDKANEIQRLQILINRTREEIARENVTQSEVDRIVTHLDARFDKLNDKLDAFIKDSKHAL